MALGGLRRYVSAEVLGGNFAAILFMGPIAAVAIMGLGALHLVAPTPIWLVPVILVGGQLLTAATGTLWNQARTRARLHLWIATQSVVVTATIYAIGWGPALSIGLVLIGQNTLVRAGSDSERAILGWTLACLAAGELCIALGWAPSLIPVPQVHGLAVLMAIGIAFSYRSLRLAVIEQEEAAALTESRERRFRALVQSSSDLVFVVDTTGAVTYASPSCRKVLGYEPELLLGSDAGELVHGDDIEALRSGLVRAAEIANGSAEFLIRVRHQEGRWIWLEGLATNLFDDPSVEGMVVNARDVTERTQRLERQTAISEMGRELLRATTLEETVTVATAAIGRVVEAARCRIVEASAEPSSPDPPVGSGADDAADVPSLRVPIGDPNRPLAHIEVSGADVANLENAQFVGSVASIVSSAMVRIRAEDAIRHQAMHDPLTGLPNRALFNDRLTQALGRLGRSGGFAAVMIVDLDGFKTVNDSLGHLAGDALLMSVADRFGARLRGFDTIARLGGDEFALLFDGLDAPAQAGVLAQRVLDALVVPLPLPDRDVAIGASVGIACTADASTDADRLLADADAAMYLAKREGKGCYRIFESAMHTAAVERMNLEQELRLAVRNRALTVFYQPIVDTATGRVTSFEALARWNHPTRGFVPPDTFIPVAEEAGLIVDLGRDILTEACRQASEWHARLPDRRPSVSVNASRLQLANPTFVEHVTDALARTGLEPSALIVEVTESILASESRQVIATLDELRRHGVRVAIDDFGTGYSSFAALAELPIDILKIDKRFIDNLTDHDQGRGFVTAILHLADTLRLETTAEGVERVDQREALADLGCTHIQGYLFSPPMTGDRTHEYLASDRSIDEASLALR